MLFWAYDAFLGSVLQGALANETERPTMQAFQELEELSLVSEWEMKSLEYLDIYRDCTVMTPQQHSDGISHFGLLQGFERLKILCIHPETLLGGNGDDPRAPFRLKDTLPTSLESLTFYGTSGLIIDLELESQFREVLQGGSFPNLKCVTFEDVSEFVHYYIPSYVKRPNQAVKALCYEARVNFLERKIRHFPKGGKQQPWYINKDF
ncbi:hypothetical protein V496_01379 [Pseudogymnoascus sp. VKM F-4515 (FW-2607)]|nr:hypothetical protein V496_01379 [Pseudogymnoascus sp. VKM F-4515 (FW-2607)]